MRHKTKLKTSYRLQKMLKALRRGGEYTTMQLCRYTDDCNVSTTISDLRDNKINVLTIYKGKNNNGRRVFTYQLV